MVSTTRIYRTHSGLISHSGIWWSEWKLLRSIWIVHFNLLSGQWLAGKWPTRRKIIFCLMLLLLLLLYIMVSANSCKGIVTFFVGISETFSLAPKTKPFFSDFFCNRSKSTKYAENYTNHTNEIDEYNVMGIIFGCFWRNTISHSFMFIRRIITSCLLIRACAELNANITHEAQHIIHRQVSLSLSFARMIRKGNWKIVWLSVRSLFMCAIS